MFSTLIPRRTGQKVPTARFVPWDRGPEEECADLSGELRACLDVDADGSLISDDHRVQVELTQVRPLERQTAYRHHERDHLVDVRRADRHGSR